MQLNNRIWKINLHYNMWDDYVTNPTENAISKGKKTMYCDNNVVSIYYPFWYYIRFFFFIWFLYVTIAVNFFHLSNLTKWNWSTNLFMDHIREPFGTSIHALRTMSSIQIEDQLPTTTFISFQFITWSQTRVMIYLSPSRQMCSRKTP